MHKLRTWGMVWVGLAAVIIGGCPAPTGGVLTQGMLLLEQDVTAVSAVQVADPRDITLPQVLIDEGDAIALDPDVTVISDIEVQLPLTDLPRTTVLGFTNLTGLDLFIAFSADGQAEGIYVFNNETLLLSFACLSEVDLLSDDEFDPDTGLLVDRQDLTDNVFVNAIDFVCGDALVLTFNPEDVPPTAVTYDLEK